MNAAERFKNSLLILMLTAIAIATFCLSSQLQAATETDKKHIVFLCYGNIQRSVVADIVFKELLEANNLQNNYDSIARGLQGSPGSPVVPTFNNLKYYNAANDQTAWELSEPTLKELGIDEQLKTYKSTVVSPRDLEEADLIVAMDEKVWKDPGYGVIVQYPQFADKVVLIGGKGIKDAYDSKPEDNKHRTTILEVNHSIRRDFKELITMADQNSTK